MGREVQGTEDFLHFILLCGMPFEESLQNSHHLFACDTLGAFTFSFCHSRIGLWSKDSANRVKTQILFDVFRGEAYLGSLQRLKYAK